MSKDDPSQATSFAGIGGLNDQIRELREVIELPLKNPELFLRVGIKPPKGVLLYGPPGTGKTLLAKAVASSLDTNFLKVVSSAIVDKYIGESARLIREMFGYAKEHEPCVSGRWSNISRRPAVSLHNTGHLHGRDRRYRWSKILGRHICRSRDPANPHGASQPTRWL